MNKKKIIIYGSILAGLGVFGGISYYITEVVFKKTPYKFDAKESTFSYMDEKNQIRGYKHVKFYSWRVTNPATNKKEYFLNDFGKKYLVQRFMETSIAGPEIAGLRAIHIGGTTSKDDAYGLYAPAIKSIFINPNSFYEEDGSFVEKNPESVETQKRRVEVIIQTLIHEYGHHLFTSYVGTPTKVKDVVQVKSENENQFWNKKFYEEFKNLFYGNNDANPNLIDQDMNLTFTDETLKELSAKYGINYEVLIDLFKQQLGPGPRMPKTIQEFFKDANELNYVPTYTEKKISYGISYFVNDNGEIIKRSLSESKDEAKWVEYYYSMSELVTRKLLLSTFKWNKSQGLYLFDSSLTDYLTSGYLAANNNSPIDIKYLRLIRFVKDNVFLSLQQIFNGKEFLNSRVEDPGKADDYLNLINKMVGHETKDEISIIVSKSPWTKQAGDSVATKSKEAIYTDAKYIKLGGYLPSDDNDYNAVGYMKDGKFVKLSDIEKHAYHLGYKNHDFAYDWKDELDDNDYYWYMPEFVNSSKIVEHELYFAKIAEGQVPKVKAITTYRNNDYGLTTSFDGGIAFTINGNDTSSKAELASENKKWWVVPNNESGKVKLRYEDWNFKEA